jgi:type I restriction enzyme M protein
MSSNINISDATIALIDSLKSTTNAFGLAGTGSEYRIVTEMFLYKFFNDKFGYEAKLDEEYGERLRNAEKWDAEYDTFTDEEVEDLFSYLPASVPRLRPEHTLSHLYNASSQGDFSTLLDQTLVDIANLNARNFSVSTSGKNKVNIFNTITNYVTDTQKRDEFARSLMRNVASFNFEDVFGEKYDFFSRIFEHLLKGFNNAGGGKYAEYYTPRAIAQVMARLLVGDDAELRGVTCYDPSAGTGTLLMALAHQIGEERCTIYSQDISEKSSEMLRLNLILNNFASSLQNVVQGNTLTEPSHKEDNGTLKKFDFIVSNPPFKLDFPEFRETLATDSIRFWAGVPNAVKKVDPTKPKMAIYTCFIQHVLNSLKPNGKGAIVIPTGFITAKSGVEKRILQRIVDEHWVYGVVSMPSNVFATTGTNVSVLFFDKSAKADKVILIDASKLGEEYKEGNNKKSRLRDFEVEQIVRTFRNCEAVDDFSVAVTYDEIKEKGYSLSAGQYFDIKIDYVDITEEEFNRRMANFQQTLTEQFEESHRLEKEIMAQLQSLKFNENVGKDNE